tara:strand:- start:5636 stop:6079 length:444 start_codon:yes stop_codon:yes gene_type:complete
MKVNITYTSNYSLKEKLMGDKTESQYNQYDQYNDKNGFFPEDGCVYILWIGVFFIFIAYFGICYSQCREERIRDRIRQNERIEPLILRRQKIEDEQILNEKCVICLEDYQNDGEITILPCNHSFHYKCMYQWIQKERSCPLCRMSIV